MFSQLSWKTRVFSTLSSGCSNIRYWEERRDRLREGLRATDQVHLEGFPEEMNLYADIRSLLPRLSGILGDMNMPLASAQVKSEFADLIDLVTAKLGE